jgi:hypothetical protein
MTLCSPFGSLIETIANVGAVSLLNLRTVTMFRAAWREGKDRVS